MPPNFRLQNVQLIFALSLALLTSTEVYYGPMDWLSYVDGLCAWNQVLEKKSTNLMFESDRTNRDLCLRKIIFQGFSRKWQEYVKEILPNMNNNDNMIPYCLKQYLLQSTPPVINQLSTVDISYSQSLNLTNSSHYEQQNKKVKRHEQSTLFDIDNSTRTFGSPVFENLFEAQTPFGNNNHLAPTFFNFSSPNQFTGSNFIYSPFEPTQTTNSNVGFFTLNNAIEDFELDSQNNTTNNRDSYFLSSSDTNNDLIEDNEDEEMDKFLKSLSN